MFVHLNQTQRRSLTELRGLQPKAKETEVNYCEEGAPLVFPIFNRPPHIRGRQSCSDWREGRRRSKKPADSALRIRSDERIA